ncbi:MAG: glycosyltransferase [Bacteroidales bacterium]
MGIEVLIVQRFYYNFREGFFEYLSDRRFDFKLINSTSSRGKVKVHDDAINIPYIEKIFYFFLGQNYVIFPFLVFNLIRINPKIIVTEGGQNSINNFQIFIYSKIFNRKYIIWDLGKAYAEFNSSLSRSLYMRFYKFLLKQAYYIYVYNTQSTTYFKSLGIEQCKLIVLNNTIDTRKIKKIKSTYISHIPPELLEPSKKGYTFLIFVGALIKNKNIESLPELMKKLGDDYFLIIVGDGCQSYKTELLKLFMGTNHVFVGYKKNEQLATYYNLASFSILPGLGGLSINQSMAFGVPVICKSADGAEKDLVIYNETGYIYKDLPDAYNYIVSKTNEDWKAMGQKAELFLYTNHSMESMMEKFIFYSKINYK